LVRQAWKVTLEMGSKEASAERFNVNFFETKPTTS
jgi:hypothetical protein